MSTSPAFEIYALRYGGPVVRPQSFMRWLGDWTIMEPAAYFFWVLKASQDDGPVIVVDTGLTPELAAKAGMPGYLSPPEVLARLGIDADQVERLIITHLHFDHLGGLEFFPRARVHVQRTEFDFWLTDPLSRRPVFQYLRDENSLDILAGLKGSDRLALVDGESEILPGVECIPAPGHTPGLQAVAVNTAAGRAVLGSDCGPTFRSYADGWPSCLIFDLPAWLRSMDRLKAEVSSPELLFPSHDPALGDDFPEIAPRVTRLA